MPILNSRFVSTMDSSVYSISSARKLFDWAMVIIFNIYGTGFVTMNMSSYRHAAFATVFHKHNGNLNSQLIPVDVQTSEVVHYRKT